MAYPVELATGLLRQPHKLGQLLVLRDLVPWIRVEFLGAAARLGLLSAVDRPHTEAELADRLEVTEPGLLRSLLELGAALGELRHDGERWSLRGARAKALADPAVPGMAALTTEFVVYDADVYAALERRLRGEPPGDYLSEHGELVAEGSRVDEPLLAPFLSQLVRQLEPRRILDVGCGSGVYLRAAAGAAPGLTGDGIDLDVDAVALARRNLDTWGLSERFAIHQADVRDLPPSLRDPYDLVLLFQSIYYFPVDERTALLTQLRSLVPDGVVAVVSMVTDGHDPLGAHYDLLFRSTAGNYPVPAAAEVRAALTEAGFRRVDERRLAPRQPLRAFVAHR
ncbi:MAG: class I SAM-dependent methyltransferase [Acidimicrobiales bacterium]